MKFAWREDPQAAKNKQASGITLVPSSEVNALGPHVAFERRTDIPSERLVAWRPMREHESEQEDDLASDTPSP